MKAIVIDDFERRGGGQVYGLALADSLENIRYSTFFLTNTEELGDKKERIAFKIKYEFVEGESKIMNLFKIFNLKKQLSKIDLRGFDLSINNHPNVFVMKSDFNILHGFSFLDPWVDEDGNVIKIVPPILLKSIGLYDIYDGALFLPNSRYTLLISSKLFRFLDIDAVMGDVLYPPIIYSEPNVNEKKNQVLLMGRINPDKVIENAVEIANEEGFKLVIAGYLNRGDESYYLKLKRKARMNVDIRPNITNGQKETLMEESSTILSLNRKENFGISIAEAMNKGCVPVVPRSGGPWLDILEEGKYGLGFSKKEEIGELIGKSFLYDSTDRYSIAKSVERFSIPSFEKRLKQIADDVISSHR